MPLPDFKVESVSSPLVHLLNSQKGREALSDLEYGELLALFGALQFMENDWGNMFTQLLVMLDDAGQDPDVTIPKIDSKLVGRWKEACAKLRDIIPPPDVDVFARFFEKLLDSGKWLEEVWLPLQERIRIASEYQISSDSQPVTLWKLAEAPWYLSQLAGSHNPHAWLAHIPKRFEGFPSFLEGMSYSRTPMCFKLLNGDLVLIGD